MIIRSNFPKFMVESEDNFILEVENTYSDPDYIRCKIQHIIDIMKWFGERKGNKKDAKADVNADEKVSGENDGGEDTDTYAGLVIKTPDIFIRDLVMVWVDKWKVDDFKIIPDDVPGTSEIRERPNIDLLREIVKLKSSYENRDVKVKIIHSF